MTNRLKPPGDRSRRTCSRELERKIADKRAAGIDVISLGIGDPDRPTPPLIVQAMQEAVSEPERTSTPPTAAARTSARPSRASTCAASASTLDPETEVIPAIGAKECIFNLNLAFLDPGDVRAGGRPRLPGLHRRAVLAGAEPVLMALIPSAASRPTSTRSTPRSLAQGRADVPQLPQQPDRRGRARWLLRGGRRFRARERDPRRPRHRLLGDRPTTATWRRRSSLRPARRTSASRSSRSPRATT